MTKKSFVPALKFNFLTPFYDFISGIFGLEKRIKTILLERADISSGQRVLDFGCGTGSLAIMAKIRTPGAFVYGVDIDENIIKIARRKAAGNKACIRLDLYDGLKFQYKSGHFSAILSSLVFHHIQTEQKKNILKEIYRILKPGGRIWILDMGMPSNRVMRFISSLLKRLEPIGDNISGAIPFMLDSAGFSNTKAELITNSLIGTLYIFSGVKKV